MFTNSGQASDFYAGVNFQYETLQSYLHMPLPLQNAPAENYAFGVDRPENYEKIRLHGIECYWLIWQEYFRDENLQNYILAECKPRSLGETDRIKEFLLNGNLPRDNSKEFTTAYLAGDLPDGSKYEKHWTIIAIDICNMLEEYFKKSGNINTTSFPSDRSVITDYFMPFTFEQSTFLNDTYDNYHFVNRPYSGLVGAYAYAPSIIGAFFSMPINRAWRKDYFTAALPWQQKGEVINLPISSGLSATATSTVPYQQLLIQARNPNDAATGNKTLNMPSISRSSQWNRELTSAEQETATNLTGRAGTPEATSTFNQEAGVRVMFNGADDNPSVNEQIMIGGRYQADNGQWYDSFKVNTEVSIQANNYALSVNDLRQLTAMQIILEGLAKGGSRYIEYLKFFFGTSPLDSTLQRPEFLGSMTSPVQVSEVLNTDGAGTSPDNDATALLGYQGGKAIAAGGNLLFDRTFREYGFITVIMNVQPRALYSQGIKKMYSKFDTFDYYNPQMDNLGEMPVRRKELFYNVSPASFDDSLNNEAFGYLPAWSEYKTDYSSVSGQFGRFGYLQHYHMATFYNKAPLLNSAFITATPQARPFALWDNATAGAHPIWADIYFDVQVSRPMRYFNKPQIN